MVEKKRSRNGLGSILRVGVSTRSDDKPQVLSIQTRGSATMFPEVVGLLLRLTAGRRVNLQRGR
jgi:hypothetical protein